MELLTVSQASKVLGEAGACLIDVRTPAEFTAVHAIGAINIPLDRLTADSVRSLAPQAQKFLFICQRGGRSKQACEKVLALGLSNVSSVDGGTEAWDAAQLPVQRGTQATISLERQVRIAAGSLVLLGVLLGALVSPYGILLSAFVGAGLIFAGVTDWCGMALALGRMPWNQRCGR
jgi:rhodanese-related sulfurtransferase